MKYEIILADFPWPYTAAGTAKLPYESMSWEKLRDFPWGEFCAPTCLVLSWVTGPLLAKQMALHEEWALHHNWHFIGIPWVWVKTTKDGRPMSAVGPRPSLVKSQAEMVVAYSTKKGRPYPILHETEHQWIFAPRGAHSEKPAELRDRIVGLLGDRPRLELFARQEVEGWDQIGAQSKTPRIF